MQIPFFNNRHTMFQDSTGQWVHRSQQEISQDFLDARKAERNEQDSRSKMGDDVRVASVPVFLLEKWKRDDGFDPMACRGATDEEQMKILREMVRRLKAEGYEHFLNTTKSV